MTLSMIIGLGDEHDSKKLVELIRGLCEKPRQLYADSTYDIEFIGGLESMSVEPNIPMNPRNGRRQRPYNIELYKKIMSAVERFSGWIKNFRRIILRYEKLASTYKALATIASIIIHLRYRI